MIHDPMCPAGIHDWLGDEYCRCDLIARVREEWYEAQSEAWEQGFHYALDRAREAVAAVAQEIRSHGGTSIDRDDALAAIDGLKP